MFTNANVCYGQTPYINNYVNSEEYQIKVSNQSSLTITVKLTYSLGGISNEVTSPNITSGSEYSTPLPTKSSRITLTIYDNSDPENPTTIYKIPLFYPRTACYLVSGTDVSSTVREVSCSSLGSSNNTCSNCCCCCCCMCNYKQ